MDTNPSGFLFSSAFHLRSCALNFLPLSLKFFPDFYRQYFNINRDGQENK